MYKARCLVSRVYTIIHKAISLTWAVILFALPVSLGTHTEGGLVRKGNYKYHNHETLITIIYLILYY